MPNYIEIEEALGGQADVLPDRRTSASSRILYWDRLY